MPRDKFERRLTSEERSEQEGSSAMTIQRKNTATRSAHNK